MTLLVMTCDGCHADIPASYVRPWTTRRGVVILLCPRCYLDAVDGLMLWRRTHPNDPDPPI